MSDRSVGSGLWPVVAVTVLDLVWRGADLLVATLRWLSELSAMAFGNASLLASVASLLVRSPLSSESLATGFNIAFLLVVFYSFVPVAYPEPLDEEMDDLPVRVLATLLCALFGGSVWFVLANPNWSLPNPVIVAVVVPLLLVGVGGGLVGYYRLHKREGLRSRENPLVERRVRKKATAYGRTESDQWEREREMFERLDAMSAPARLVSRLVVLMGLGVFFVFPAALFSIIAVVINGFFPLLEILVIGGLFVDRAPRRSDALYRLSTERWSKLERALYDRVEYVGHGAKGTWTVAIVVLGVSMSLFWFIAVTENPFLTFVAPHHIDTGLGLVTTKVGSESIPLYVWLLRTFTDHPVGNVIIFAQDASDLSMGVSLYFAVPVVAFYGLWYWIRVYRRLPAFLEVWEANERERTGEASMAKAETEVARPPGFMLPPTLLFLGVLWVGVGRLTAGDYGVGSDVVLLVDVVYAVGWPVLLGVVGWTVYRGYHGVPQPPVADGRAMVAAYLIQWTGSIAGFVLLDITTVGRSVGLWIVGTGFGAFFFTPDLNRRGRTDGQSYLQPAAFAAFGVLLLLPPMLSDVGYGGPLVAVGGTFLLLAAVNAWLVYEQRSADES